MPSEMIFFPGNDNIQYHIRSETEALILFFKYRIASILKLTYKCSIHLILNSLLLSKRTYKEGITETVMQWNQVHFSNTSVQMQSVPVFWAPNKCSQDASPTIVSHRSSHRATWGPWKMSPWRANPIIYDCYTALSRIPSSGPILFINFKCS